uniref:Uncharacterized protein n=2 Tax=Oryza TaxID=4527 RepID=A0A0E0QW44_ORYRU
MDIADDTIVVGRTWNILSIIPMDHYFPPPRQHSWDLWFFSFSLVDYYVYNSDDGEEDRDDDDYGDKTRAISPIMQHNNEASGSQSPWWSDLWCDKDFHQDNDAPIPVISANVNVIGFVEEANAVLLHAAGRGVHVIDIETKDTQRVAACAYYSHVFAYISFNTAGIP